MVKSAAEKRTAIGKAIRNTDSAAPKPICKCRVSSEALPKSKACKWSATQKEIPMEVTESAAVAREALKTRENFPSTKSVREIGLERMVSMVPRSFSPAVKSMAGYMAPVMHSKMTM